MKCWRGYVYPKGSSAHSPGKSTNGSMPIPLVSLYQVCTQREHKHDSRWWSSSATSYDLSMLHRLDNTPSPHVRIGWKNLGFGPGGWESWLSIVSPPLLSHHRCLAAIAGGRKLTTFRRSNSRFLTILGSMNRGNLLPPTNQSENIMMHNCFPTLVQNSWQNGEFPVYIYSLYSNRIYLQTPSCSGCRNKWE